MKKLMLSVIGIVMFCHTNAQLPLLNSDPSSQPVIFLDFDGHLVTNTSWNYAGPINCAGAGLTSSQVTEIFNRVAEDFRPFTVNITTDSAKFLAAPLNRRMRVILTTTSDWYGNAGGVAYVNSFTWGDDTPCFVFTQLLNFNVKNIAEAVSHETGHTLGLYHQSSYNSNCVKISDYNPGIGSGETGWAPIMGVGYYRNLTLWHNGPNPYGCNNLQNDMEIIARPDNGINMRADDYGNTPGTSATLSLINNQFSSNGRFDYTNDADLFRLSLQEISAVSIRLRPFSVGASNLSANSDILMQLFNNNMEVLKSVNPLDSLQSSIDTALAKGTYYIKATPVANSNTGTYGMLGAYSLSGTALPLSVLPLRKLELLGKSDGGKHILSWLVDADEQIVDIKLEYAMDNQSFFRVLSELKGTAGSYTYSPAEKATYVYRLKVTFDNNKTYYSGLISLKLKSGNTLELLANPVYNGIIGIKGATNESYELLGSNGVLLKRGVLSAGLTQIPVAELPSGIYFIRFSEGREIIKSEKLILQ